MPSFNRRGFLQFASAAGVAPLLPALPAPAIAASGKSAISKALWTSLYAHSGSTAKFVNVAQNMGLSNSAIQGVSARSIGARVAMSAAAPSMERLAAENTSAPQTTTSDMFERPSKALQKLEETTRCELDQHDVANPHALSLDAPEQDSAEPELSSPKPNIDAPR